MGDGVRTMEKGIDDGLVLATEVAKAAELRRAANGIRYAAFGDSALEDVELGRMVQAVPVLVAAAVAGKSYYFVPLALAERRADEPAEHRVGGEGTMISPVYSTELADLSICHRNVTLGGEAGEGVFISSRLMHDRFSLAFEFFINVAHAFVEEAGVAQGFAELVWNQAVADVRGETSQDAWESRSAAMGEGASGSSRDGKPRVDEKAKTEYLAAAFSDSIAIYMLSLALDFDYSELREREYPLLAPQALAERLRMVAKLFPPNAEYEFAVRYRRRA
jgi:hypothetical protein